MTTSATPNQQKQLDDANAQAGPDLPGGAAGGLSVGELEDIFHALERLAEGDPTVHLPGESGSPLAQQLRNAINRSAQALSEIVDTAHEFAIGLAEHFDVLNRVSTGDLRARIQGESSEEILQVLKEATNATIDHLAAEIVSRREAQEQLQESERRYRTLFQKSSDPMLVMDKGTLVDCNEATLSLFGWEDKQAFLRQHPAALSPPKQGNGRSSDKLAYAMVQTALEQGSYRYDWIYKRVDGTTFPAEVLITPVPVGGRRLIHSVIRDITQQRAAEDQQRRLQAQLMQSQKLEALGTLAGGIAHDFNNTLAPIIGYTEMALDDMPKHSQTGRNLEHVLLCADRAKNLIAQILAFARDTQSETAPLQVTPFVKETVQLLSATLPATIEIRTRVLESDDWVSANPAQVHQILMNLCTNAAHALESVDGGLLEINLEKLELGEEEAKGELLLEAGPYLSLTVRDTGCGIGPEELRRIFEPFFTTKEVGEGTGMGLAMVHGIVEELGGTIRVHSALDEGSSFQVLLPRITADTRTRRPAPAARPLKRGSECILLVDDEELVVDFMARALTQMGYQVVSKTDSEEAFETFAADPDQFDLVITDQTMPKLTGTTLAHRLLEIREDVPIVLCTGFSKTVSPKEAARAGFRAYVTKPFSLADLNDTIRRLLDEQKPPLYG